MLIFILIDVQYSQKAIFSFEKGSNGQNHSTSGSHHSMKIFSQQSFWFPPPQPLPLFGKHYYRVEVVYG